MNKKAKVKMLLDLISDLKSIPTKMVDGREAIKFPEFYEMPEIKSVITLLKHLKVDQRYLSENGFVVASMMISSQLESGKKHTCSICEVKYSGFGNNAEPVNSGRCCDGCNITSVIPARLESTTTVKLDPKFAKRKGKSWLKENGWDDETIAKALAEELK